MQIIEYVSHLAYIVARIVGCIEKIVTAPYLRSRQKELRQSK